jgi:hypothetical protein
MKFLIQAQPPYNLYQKSKWNQIFFGELIIELKNTSMA